MVLNKEGKVELDIPKGTDIENQVQMIGLTKEDLRILNNLQPFVNDQIDNIVTRFYENLVNEPSLLNIINNNSSIDRLRKTLKQHITEMFDGVIDQHITKKEFVLLMFMFELVSKQSGICVLFKIFFYP